MTGALPLGVDVVVDALRTRIAAALPGVEVYDGPSSASDRAYAARSVTVASAFEDDQDAVAYEAAYSGAARRVTETLTVACSVYAGSGGTEDEIETLRGAAVAMLMTIGQTLDADPTLGDLVARASVDTARLVQGSDEYGVGVYVGFTVTVVRLP